MCTAIEKFGTDQMKENYLPLMARGELRGGIALRTRLRNRSSQYGCAAEKDDHYILNGTKQWITNSVEGNVLAVLVKTNVDANPRHKGMSLDC